MATRQLLVANVRELNLSWKRVKVLGLIWLETLGNMLVDWGMQAITCQLNGELVEFKVEGNKHSSENPGLTPQKGREHGFILFEGGTSSGIIRQSRQISHLCVFLMDSLVIAKISCHTSGGTRCSLLPIVTRANGSAYFFNGRKWHCISISGYVLVGDNLRLAREHVRTGKQLTNTFVKALNKSRRCYICNELSTININTPA
ncbi:hypothetical protein CR513_03637, partial [Mucuna pruriens]